MTLSKGFLYCFRILFITWHLVRLHLQMWRISFLKQLLVRAWYLVYFISARLEKFSQLEMLKNLFQKYIIPYFFGSTSPCDNCDKLRHELLSLSTTLYSIQTQLGTISDSLKAINEKFACLSEMKSEISVIKGLLLNKWVVIVYYNKGFWSIWSYFILVFPILLSYW